MARRFSREEKGKSHLVERNEHGVIRIKAPCVDNSALIKENALTLIGRVTNPQEQKMWALIPALPRKWRLQGRTSGSDLGNGCFLFRFESEEDLQGVLANRPYHYAYWMVIIQRWEPVISASFPSQIPFWIRIKGLPLHFWHEDMLYDIGKELGTVLNHELTKTTARVKILLDGLKPLTKKAIIEFESGEESWVYLDYERLENHCSFCNSLSHLKKDCVLFRDEILLADSNNGKDLQRQEEEPVRRSPSHRVRQDPSYRLQEREINLPYSNSYVEKNSREGEPFQARVDRHGNSFGERISTKQTRNPPPARIWEVAKPNTALSGARTQEVEKQTSFTSPQFNHHRDSVTRPRSQGRALFPPKEKHWRQVQPPTRKDSLPIEGPPAALETQIFPLPELQNIIRTTAVIPSREEVMEELHEVTRQYLSCSDPKEAAARRQRVLNGDARGETEEAADAIIAAAIKTKRSGTSTSVF